MTVEDNIRTYLTQRKCSAWVDDEKQRLYVDVICTYYGFGGLTVAGLEEVAIKCNVGYEDTKNRREASRLIIKNNFRDEVSLSDLPALREVCEVLNQKDVHRADELEAMLVHRGLVSSGVSIDDIIRLLGEIPGGNTEHAVFTPDLVKAKRSSRSGMGSGRLFVIRTAFLRSLKKSLKRARTRPGSRGMARLESLELDLLAQDEAFDWELFMKVLTSHEEYRAVEVGGQVWYAFDDRENFIVNMAAKIFSQEDCKGFLVEDLAGLLGNAMRGRLGNQEVPPTEAIAGYLRGSDRFYVANNRIVYDGPTREPTAIEQDVIEYLREKGQVNSSEFRGYLLARGHSDAFIQKNIYNSPFVHVDKSE